MYSPPQDIDSLLFDLIWVNSFVEPNMKFVPDDSDGQTNSCCRRLELPTLNYNASTSHANCRSVQILALQANNSNLEGTH